MPDKAYHFIPNQSTTNHNAISTTYVCTPLLYSTFSTYIYTRIAFPMANPMSPASADSQKAHTWTCDRR
jgi:hypothetical protein